MAYGTDTYGTEVYGVGETVASASINAALDRGVVVYVPDVSLVVFPAVENIVVFTGDT